MNNFSYNDNELIYLIRMGSEDAYTFLNDKYKRFIYAKIKKFNLNDIDDSFQEGLIALYHAVISFNECYDKTFNKYFDRILNNRLLDVKRKKDTNYEIVIAEAIDINKYILREDNYKYEEQLEEIKSVLNILSKREKKIFDMLYIEKRSTIDIANEIGVSTKNLYKIIYQIKKKIRKNVIK